MARSNWGKGLYDFAFKTSPMAKKQYIKSRGGASQEETVTAAGEPTKPRGKGGEYSEAQRRVEWFKTTSPEERIEDRKQNLQKSMANIQEKVGEVTTPVKEKIKKTKVYFGVQKPEMAAKGSKAEEVEELGDIYLRKGKKKNRATQGFMD